VSVKNLFYNVPARRNFLKSNTLELKYIIEEFFRVALVHPDISFVFYNHDKILHQLPSGNLKQRISNLYGPAYSQRLIPVQQQTDLVNISGFIGKPEFAKKTRGEQYFFTNGRFMKSPYLHHAVESAFKELIPDDSIPSYYIYMEVDPQTIDVNIHPTKTEINFQDIKSIYAILHAAVKQSIGKFNLSPSLDFEVEQSMIYHDIPPDQPIRPPTITVNPDFNPFEIKSDPQTKFSFPSKSQGSATGWQKLYDPLPPAGKTGFPDTHLADLNIPESQPSQETLQRKKPAYQLLDAFLVTHTKTGIIVIDQQHAHQRILYERFQKKEISGFASGQHQLLPRTVMLSPGDEQLLREWEKLFGEMGFEISDLGNGTFALQAIPPDLEPPDVQAFLESILETLKSPGQENKLTRDQMMAKALAMKLAVRRGKKLHQEEIDSIIENLFACNVPDLSPDGKPTMIILSFEELNRKFKINS